MTIPSHIHLQEAANEAFISLKPDHSLRVLTDSFCQHMGFRPRILFETDEPLTIKGLVQAGQGIAFVPAITWQGAIGSGVSHVPISEPKCQRAIGLSWSTDRPLSLAAQQFRQFVIDYFACLQSQSSH